MDDPLSSALTDIPSSEDEKENQQPQQHDEHDRDSSVPVSLSQSTHTAKHLTHQQVKEVERLATIRSSPRLRERRGHHPPQAQAQAEPQGDARGHKRAASRRAGQEKEKVQVRVEGERVLVTHVEEVEEASMEGIEVTPSPEQEQVTLVAAGRGQVESEALDEEMSEEMVSSEEEMSSEEELELEDPEPEEEEEEEEEESEGEEDNRSDGEKESIEIEMAQLVANVPQLEEDYLLIDRLGEGTFSSVYKAIDLRHATYDNSQWVTSATTTSNNRRKGKVYVALKRIYVTSSPERIMNELDILNDLRGKKNVAYLIQALRHEDQVIAVMPFNRHQDFRTYYRNASLPLIRSYFAALFRALSSTHSQHILHRDVKPANFLYDVLSGTGTLCDYGLAQKIGGDDWQEWRSQCCHSLPGPSWDTVGLDRNGVGEMVRNLGSGKAPGVLTGLHGIRLARPISLWEQVEKIEREVDGVAEDEEDEEVWQERERAVWRPEGRVKAGLKTRYREEIGWYKAWRAGESVGNNGTHHYQNGTTERVGFLKDDRRGSVRANRAGTRGFRAPEVLLKCPDQTVALDIWSAGIILLCFLTRRFPFFNSNDDTEALVEIAAIFGKKKIEKCAALHNRTFLTNIPTLDPPRHANLHDLVKSLNPSIVVENSNNPYGPIPSTIESDATWYPSSQLAYAIDLMKKCLETDLTRRWTAQECLRHPFFTEEGNLFDHGGGVLGFRRPIDM